MGKDVFYIINKTISSTDYLHIKIYNDNHLNVLEADLPVIPQGVCFDAIRANFDQATIQAATKLTAGNICVSPSFTLPCTQVIHCCCSYWNSDGEKVNKYYISLILFCPLNPNIKIRILICYPHSFPTEVVGRS